MKENYKPIADYGAIGNLRSVPLVGRDGSIDWCCFPHLDKPSVFAAILDHRRGGRFKIGIPGAGLGEQHYVEDSNVLKTTLQSGRGHLVIIDFMPLDGNIDRIGRSTAPDEIHRIVSCEGGDLEAEVEWSPRFDYGRSSVDIRRANGGWIAAGSDGILSLGGLEEGEIVDENGPTLKGRLRLKKGERLVLVTRWGTEDTSCNIDSSLAQMRRTTLIWQEWAHREGAVHKHEWAGEWLPAVIRSELVLKMLSHADTGAIAAAPTTSLPETIGGIRNWDYRFTWIRDAAMTTQALISLGHGTEAIELLHWMERVSVACIEGGLNLQILYGLHGETELPEEELSHLEGWRGSRPVRIGNGAEKQFQLEVYGELLNMVYELARRGERLNPTIADFLARVTDHVHDVWHKPDQGIWELRGAPRHFTYSKVMAWVALDRAVHLAEEYGLPGDHRRWGQARQRIREQVLEHGYNKEIGAFVQSFDSQVIDAANLRIPLMEFLPFDDPRVQGTIDVTMKELMDNSLVYRYLADDGLPGKEGAFGLCTFWLVDALALSNRLEEARHIFERMLSHANHVGLLPEQFDAKTGEFLGNFPQAFTHIGLINSALYMAYAEGREVPEHSPIGTEAHRLKIGRPK